MNALCQALEDAGVRCAFGIPGTQNVALFDALRRSRIRTVLTASELGASFAAGAFARVSGEVGVVVTIAGPGFMYALPGMAEARADSAAVLLLTGLPARAPGRRFQLQAIDQEAIAAPVVKSVISVSDAAGLGAAVHDAVALARGGEPGPVLLQVADDLLAAAAAPQRRHQPEPVVDAAALDAAVQALVAARRPVLFVGQGTARAAAALVRLAERLHVPVLTTPSGRGVLPEDHVLSVGFDPLRHDLAAANALLETADLILALGCKLAHNGTAGFALSLPPQHLVHVDASADVLGANYPARIKVCASAEHFLDAVVAANPARSAWDEADVATWRARLHGRPIEGLPEPTVGANRGSPSDFFAAIRRALPRDAVLVTDSGMHQVLARRYYHVWATAGLLFPSDFQSMGFGLPGAIGAKFAAPHRPVVAVIGDGGLRMTGMELTTAVRERLPLVVFVFSDGRLNQIRLQQLAEFGSAHAVELGPLDLERFAAATGAAFLRLEGDPGSALAAARTLAGPLLVEVPVGDSGAIHATRVRGLAREAVRRTIGPRVLSWLRRWR